MPEVIPQTDASVPNAEVIASQPAMLSNLLFANLVANINLSQQNAVATQQALNELGLAILAKSVNLISNLSPEEARSDEELLTGNSLAETLADLKATLQAFQPVTAKP